MFTRISFLLAILISAVGLVSAGVKKPNFIIIFADDQGYADLGCFGSENIKTPHIDRMAEEGRKFTSFLVASSVCTPSRAALMTGCYPKRIGMEKHVIFPGNNHGLHTDEVTIADLLKGAGYATACIGKWHLGHRKPFLPTSQGFDTYFGIPYSNDMNHPDNSNKPWGKWDELWADPESTLTRWNTPLMENEEIVELPVDQRTITRRYTDKAIEFVTENKEHPFFLYLPHSMPHLPLYVPDDVYDSNVKDAYKIVIEHIDAETGRLLKTVKELGLADNTYVIYTSDNGPWSQFKHHAGKATPLRGSKGQHTEGGQRVPCVMWAPGCIPAGTSTEAFCSTMDLLPTFAKLAGVELKTRGPIDGMDISAVMHGQNESPRDEMLYYSSRGDLKGLRQGDWKLLRLGKEEKLHLFNLDADISEKRNLADSMPERVTAMQASMVELDQAVEAGVRPRGRL
ncbi:MAG: sulfatase [Verrucomicrobia bacterium]|jgi:arylsulfatase A|nr:sulfatase [Verrucomicrobiota bacterium]